MLVDAIGWTAGMQSTQSLLIREGNRFMIAKRLLQFNLLISIFTATTFIFAPEPTLSLYGIPGDPPHYLITRYFGATHIAFAVLIWLALRANDPRFLRYIVVSFFAGDLSGTAVLLIAQMSNVMGTTGWLLVTLSFLLAVGYGYCALNKLPKS